MPKFSVCEHYTKAIHFQTLRMHYAKDFHEKFYKSDIINVHITPSQKYIETKMCLYYYILCNIIF